MKQYLNLLNRILNDGIDSDDRTGTGTLSIFSETLKFDMAEGFPLVTTKYVNYKAVLAELLWFISGSTNINDLDSKIWDEWATNDGDVGPMYGSQWRDWRAEGTEIGYDQLKIVIRNLKDNPFSRRHIVSAWNVDMLPDESISPQDNVYNGQMALAPCHKDFQFYVRNNKLSLHWNQRSVDAFLGLPFNIASYATLLLMICKLTGYKPGILSFHGVDIHIYKNHIRQVKTQIVREPLGLSALSIKTRYSIDDYIQEDFNLRGYSPHEKLKGKISV